MKRNEPDFVREDGNPNMDMIGKWTVAVVVAALLAAFLIGWAAVGYTKSVSTAQADADREKFKHSDTYAETAASFLADSYKEYNDAESDDEKNAVMEYVAIRYPNLDADAIENDTLRQFYEDCLAR